VKRFQSEYEEARRKDTQALELTITLYTNQNEEALRGLNIRPRAMKDALLAMQRVSVLTVHHKRLVIHKHTICRLFTLPECHQLPGQYSGVQNPKNRDRMY
jgi:hypothetical protein